MKKIKELPYFDRPREKLAAHGPEALSDVELLSIMLGSGIKDKDVLTVAKEILNKIKSFTNTFDVSTLKTIHGVGIAKACQIVAAVEFSRRRLLRNSVSIKKPEDALPFISHIADKKQEHFLCISLNGANEVTGCRTVTVGLLNSTQIHPREVFADVITDRAAAIMLAHNHPSGVLQPSHDDMVVTKQMVEAGNILGIEVVDHIIITKKDFFSFKAERLLP